MDTGFDVLPAIDLMEGGVVRLRRGMEDQATRYARDPLELISEFKEAGARWVHIIDLTGALKGKGQEMIRPLLEQSPLPVQLGGGLRSKEAVARALDWGARRVIVGTLFLESPEEGGSLVEEFGPQKIMGALDLKNGKAVGRGWAESGTLTGKDAAAQLSSCGVKNVLLTAVSQDGTLAGPDLEQAKQALEGSPLDYVYAGGIGSLEDLKRVRDQGGPRCRAVVFGKAYYEGKVDLGAAMELNRG